MNKIARTVIKGIITVSSMAAVNDLFGFYAPTRASQTVHRIGCNIAGCSIGYLVGKAAADAVIDGIEHGIAAYKGEDQEEE